MNVVYRVRRWIAEKSFRGRHRRVWGAVAAESGMIWLATVPALVAILWVGVGGGVAAE
jgi:N-glycosylase/DNA lyase